MKKSFLFAILTAALFMMISTSCSKKVDDSAAVNAPSNEAKTDENKAVEPAKMDDSKADNANTAENTEGDEPAPVDAQKDQPMTKLTSPQGLVMQIKNLPQNVETIDVSGTINGTYAIESIFDGMFVFSQERLRSTDNDIEKIKTAVLDIEKAHDVQNLAIEPSQDLPNIKSPVYKLTYLTGHNEDTRTCRDYYIHSEGFDFRFHTAIPADYVDEYNGKVDDMLKNLELVQNNGEG